MTNTKLTAYQVELLTLVKAGSPVHAGEPLDFDELLEALSWKPTKAAAHFSIRALVKRDLLAKTNTLLLRRGRKRVGFQLTAKGMQVFDPREPLKPEEVLAVEEDQSLLTADETLPEVFLEG